MSLRRIGLAITTVSLVICHNPVSAQESSPNMAQAREVVQRYQDVVCPLEINSNLAWWDANISGKDEDFARKEQAENQLNTVLSDQSTFAQLKSLREARLEDPVLRRQVEIMYLRYLEKQVDSELLQQMTAKANQIEQAFNVFRAQVGDESLSDSQVRQCLSESKDSARRQAVWEANKRVGTVVAADLKELVQLRNAAATKLGFADYHTMQLSLNEQDPGEVMRLFDQLDELTREPFDARKRKSTVGWQPATESRSSNCALALPRSVLPGIAQGLRHGCRHGVSRRGYSASVSGVLCGYRSADRRSAQSQRPL